MEPITETHTRCNDQYSNFDLFDLLTVLKPFSATLIEVLIEFFQLIAEMLTNHLYVNQVAIIASEWEALYLKLKMQEVIAFPLPGL